MDHLSYHETECELWLAVCVLSRIFQLLDNDFDKSHSVGG